MLPLVVLHPAPAAAVLHAGCAACGALLRMVASSLNAATPKTQPQCQKQRAAGCAVGGAGVADCQVQRQRVKGVERAVGGACAAGHGTSPTALPAIWPHALVQPQPLLSTKPAAVIPLAHDNLLLLLLVIEIMAQWAVPAALAPRR
eukprot:1157325-Pelagomonas_calceolata.AAC.9